MAIACKICSQELDAFSGGRCRKCRQLVCSDCTASGGATNAKGLLCKSCAAGEAALTARPELPAAGAPTPANAAPAASAASAASAAAPRRKLPPLSTVAALFLAALFLFGAIALYPRVEIWYNLRVLINGDDAAAAAAQEKLARRGGNYVFEHLCAIIELTPEPARSRAVRALGKIADARAADARDYLQSLMPDASPEFRAGLIEALRDQERR
ncbi:hypothetical protein AGMMS49959_14680 [Planctomycetales bacterium]|nr:hypothetical protein AGMMS49959_14680 [Planctomycetales bacterium]